MAARHGEFRLMGSLIIAGADITVVMQKFQCVKVHHSNIHSVLTVCQFPSQCLLTPLMGSKDRKCNLID